MSASPSSPQPEKSRLALYLPSALPKGEAMRQPGGTQTSGGSM